MNGLKTDFLCASSSFLTGFGSVLYLGDKLHEYNASDDPDTLAIANDWLMIGKDIRAALEKGKSVLPQAQQ